MSVRGEYGHEREYGCGWKGQTTYPVRLELVVAGWTSSRRPVRDGGSGTSDRGHEAVARPSAPARTRACLHRS